ncbi:hypothetical protein H4696_006297 [Amycolatopsis lexingtonensis]|uniref:Nucleotidyl transferase AbiEii/AbiGii toxin family protein n=1 Tax=Amycolatopsis lexingtonensis TaxID=218822 RepID=A0ABR9I7P4_9PSEU|nr:nucleotidyl transferase AbiEii/AbiGii toxin family protein [Amycolatopsis lexingtonensis]MBE1499197.1 hypothetical protein [Amycolatopsis lexingtonensis]
MAEPKRPASPRAYISSQKSRADNAAKLTGGTASELLDLHFHRRLIARVFDGDDAANWVLKGGQAMLVRWPAARYSTDVDLLSTEDSTDAAVEALKAAAADPRRPPDPQGQVHGDVRQRAAQPSRQRRRRVVRAPAPRRTHVFPFEDHVAEKICAT